MCLLSRAIRQSNDSKQQNTMTAVLIESQRGLHVLSTFDSIDQLLIEWGEIKLVTKPVRLMFGNTTDNLFTVDAFQDINNFTGDYPPRTIDVSTYDISTYDSGKGGKESV